MSRRIPINSLGIKLKEARENLGFSKDDLCLKIKDTNIDVRRINKWEKGQKFPDLNQIYKLASVLEINPNELLNIRNQIQSESHSEPNWHIRNIFGKLLKIGRPCIKFIFEIILGVCVIYLVASYKKFGDKITNPSDSEQEEFVVQVIQNEIDEYVY